MRNDLKAKQRQHAFDPHLPCACYFLALGTDIPKTALSFCFSVWQRKSLPYWSLLSARSLTDSANDSATDSASAPPATSRKAQKMREYRERLKHSDPDYYQLTKMRHREGMRRLRAKKKREREQRERQRLEETTALSEPGSQDM